MIVYAGKQFWNDFNNGDEALFQDANRPRDNDMFKIRAWIQAQKNDLRTANSGIAAQGTFYGVKVQNGQHGLVDQDGNRLFNKAYLRNSYTPSDISEIDWFTTAGGYVYSASNEADWLKSVILWRPYVNATDWDVVIWKSWVYAITAQCMFIAPSSYQNKIENTAFSSSSAFYKFYIVLLLNWQPSLYTQSRGCWGMDTFSLFYVWAFDTWDRLNTWFLHTYTTDPFLCHPSINLYRLS